MKFLGPTSSGSQADQTFSRNRYGQYVRRRAAPCNPDTAKQALARSRLATLSAGWAALTLANRNAWETWAAGHPLTDSLGQPIMLTGHAMFIRTNTGLLSAEFPTVLHPPASEPVWASLTLTVAMAGTGAVVTASVTGLVSDYALQIWVGKGGSVGRTYDRDLRLIDVYVPSDVSPMDIAAKYTATWGSPIAGNKFFYAGRAVWGQGALSVPFRGEGTVAS